MRTKRTVIIIACVMLAAFLLGASGAVQLANVKTEENADEDRLIGVLVTTEYLDLFDMDGYFKDNADKILSGGEVSQAESEKYQGRLYATIIEPPADGQGEASRDYAFDGIDGVSYFCASYTNGATSYYGNSGDEAISDGHMALSSTDEGDSISLEGTIYAACGGKAASFYYNPVYQTAGGEVYAVSGDGMSFGGEISAGMSSSHELKEEKSFTSDGETKNTSARVNITVSYIDRPEGIAIIQLDAASGVISREEYAPGKLPQTLKVNSETAYIIVETRAASTDESAAITRELYQPGTETLYAFYCREDGICVKQWCAIEWGA